MTKIMVTGGGGYIGSVLVRLLLDKGYEVLVIDRFFFGSATLPSDHPNLSIVKDDIRRLDDTSFDGIDAVVDLAAISNDPAGELDQDKTWEINYMGRVRVAKLAKDVGVKRYVLPSSCSVYGFQDDEINETAPVNPLTTYGKAIYQAEQEILPLADDQFCAVVIRQATVYGLSDRMRFDLAINGMVKGFFQSGKIPILRDGTQWRPFVHVKDTCRAMALMLEAPVDLVNGQLFNVGSDDQNLQIMPLAGTVADAIDVPFRYEWYGDPDHRSYRVSFRKISETLGYNTEYTPADGAREVYLALREGAIDGDDPKTITVQWYKHLIAAQQLLAGVVLDGELL